MNTPEQRMNEIPIDRGVFSMISSGRCGSITYTEGARALDIDWEMSGSSRYDILIAPVDLREWGNPRGEKIPEDKQRLILTRLREWLATKRIRTDIDLPAVMEISNIKCMWADCRNKALKDSAYCPQHLNLIALRK